MNALSKRRSSALLITWLLVTAFLMILKFGPGKRSFAVESYNVGVYWDSDCTERVTFIDWGILQPGSTAEVDVYVQNEEVNQSCMLLLRTEDWDPPEIADSVTFSWECGVESIALGEVAQVTLTLTAESTVSNTRFTFSIYVSGVPLRGDLVVRGLDDRIYYRIYDASSASWDSWRIVPAGVTSDSPASTVWSGRLYIVVRGADGYGLWFGWVDLVDDTFSGWEWISGATSSAPTLVNYYSQLILVVRGLDNRIYYRFYNCSSDNWASWTALPNGSTSDSPAATVLDGELHMVVRGFSTMNVNTNNSLWHATLDLTTEAFSGWTWLPGSTPSAPTTTASQKLQRIYLIARGLDNRIYYNVWDDGAWEGWLSLPSGATGDSPAGVIVGEELHIVVRGLAGTSLWHYSIDLSIDNHSGWEYMNGATSSAPTLTT